MSFPVTLQGFTINNNCVEVFVPDVLAIQAAYKQGEMAFPYWSKVWPAAIVLSEFLLQHSHYIRNKKVLELGAGLGLTSIVAAAHAETVIAGDYVPEAVAILKQSAVHNGLSNLQAMVLDWRYLPQELTANVLLLSDVNYNPEVFAILLQAINRFLDAGTTIILCTPQRLIARSFVASLLEYSTLNKEVTLMEKGREVTLNICVLVMQKDN